MITSVVNNFKKPNHFTFHNQICFFSAHLVSISILTEKFPSPKCRLFCCYEDMLMSKNCVLCTAWVKWNLGSKLRHFNGIFSLKLCKFFLYQYVTGQFIGATDNREGTWSLRHDSSLNAGDALSKLCKPYVTNQILCIAF